MQTLKLCVTVSGISMMSIVNATDITEIVPMAGRYATDSLTVISNYIPQAVPKLIGGIAGFAWIAYNALHNAFEQKTNAINEPEVDIADNSFDELINRYETQIELKKQILNYKFKTSESISNFYTKTSPLIDRTFSFVNKYAFMHLL